MLFKGALGLTPGVAGIPDPEFLTRVLSKYPSHQAWLRDLAGDDYKNVENLLRGRSQPTPRTLAELSQRFGLSAEQLNGLAHGRKDGPLLPELLLLLRLIEGVPFWVFKFLMTQDLICPQCGANALHDADVWWGRQPLRIGKAEYEFAERLLAALTVGSCFWEMLPLLGPTGNDPTEPSPSLTDPGGHPIGNWLTAVRGAYRCGNFFDLAHHLPFEEDETDPITQPRLKKWSSGQDLIPLEAGFRLIAGLPDAKVLERGLIAARVLALVADFLCAATIDTTPSSKKNVRQIIFDRHQVLTTNLLISIKLICAENEETSRTRSPG